MRREIIGFAVAAFVAAVTVPTAVTLALDDDDPGATPSSTATSTSTKARPSGSAPEIAWSIDSEATFRRQFAVFRAPFVNGGDTLITMMGLPNPTTGNFDQATMIGIAADSGKLRWRTPASDLDEFGGCADRLTDGRMVCIGDTGLVGFDADAGEVTRTQTDWETPFAISATPDRWFVAAGNPEDDDTRVYSGPGNEWSQRFDLGDAWEEVFGVGRILTTANGVGMIEIGASIVSFDLSTGKQLWATDAAARPIFDTPADDSMPIVLDNSAFDRKTGERRWTSTDLRNAYVAVAGDVVIAQNGLRVSALDLRTGTERWTKDATESWTPAAFDGDHVIGTGNDAIVAVDPGTGDIAWTMPYEAIGKTKEAFTSGGTVTAVDGRICYSTNRSIACFE